MGYAIVLTLDGHLNRVVSRTWQLFENAGIGTTPGQLSEPPHITFCNTTTGSAQDLWSPLDDVPFDDTRLRLLPFGVFPGEKQTVFFNVVFSDGLRGAHLDYHERLRQRHVDYDPAYAPEEVLFHCTIAVEVGAEELKQAAGLLATARGSESGRARALELWEYFPAKRLERRPL